VICVEKDGLQKKRNRKKHQDAFNVEVLKQEELKFGKFVGDLYEN